MNQDGTVRFLDGQIGGPANVSAGILSLLPPPHELTGMQMITLDEAKALALDVIARGSDVDKADLAFDDGRAECKRYGWVLFYNTRAFVETGDVLFALGGNGPIVVSHEREVIPLSSADAPADAIRKFERERGWAG